MPSLTWHTPVNICIPTHSCASYSRLCCRLIIDVISLSGLTVRYRLTIWLYFRWYSAMDEQLRHIFAGLYLELLGNAFQHRF